ncbi:MAG: hypothetical protein ACK45E_07935, partial [Ignavibacteria bacterium]
MITRTIVFVVTAVLCTLSLQAQDMVISEYYNIQDVNGEWTELVVVKDDLNAVDYVLTDANTGQVLRMVGPKFKDIPLWRHLRAGTIIVVWHRDIPAGIKRDIDPRDGYLEVSSRDTELFTIYLFPTAAGEISALNLADLGDVLEIVDASQAHVHALGHNKPTGAAYNAIPAPKANFDSGNVGASRSNRVTGRTLGSYGIGITKDSVVAGFNDSRGLPNRFDLARTNLGVKNINHWFWRETREPKWTSTPSVSVFSQNETSITIEWTALEDTYQQDSTTGYLILRDTLNFSSIPSGSIIDGMIITKGAKFGSAVVLDVLPTIAGNRFTDSNNNACCAAHGQCNTVTCPFVPIANACCRERECITRTYLDLRGGNEWLSRSRSRDLRRLRVTELCVLSASRRCIVCRGKYVVFSISVSINAVRVVGSAC